MTPKYVVQHVATPERIKCVERLSHEIPGLIVVEDTENKPMETFLKALTVDSCPIVRLEDDIQLCDDFCNIIQQRISEAPNHIINFFGSCKSKDKKSKWKKGKYFLWLQCCYFPAGYGEMIADYLPIWRETSSKGIMDIDPNCGFYTVDTLFDRMVGAWLDSRGESYYVSLPALVQHLPIISVINPKLSVYRQNKTFVEGGNT